MRRANAKNHEEIIKLWEPVFGFEKDTLIKNFLRHFWISNYGDVKSQSLYREIKDHVLVNDVPSLKFSKSLKKSAQVYNSLLSAVHTDIQCQELLDEVNNMGSGAKILYPPILALVEKATDEEQRSAMKALVNLYLRNSIVGERESSRLEDVIYKSTREYRESGDISKFTTEMEVAKLDDDEFEEAFKRVSIKQSRIQRYILTKIEDNLDGLGEKNVANSSKVHVEHIYPQSPLAGENVDNHDNYINKLGNLTLLSKKLNEKIQNGIYSNKLPEFQKSSIVMTNTLPSVAEWKVEQIVSRQEGLAKIALKVW